MSTQPRRLGPAEVFPIGLGCMNLHWAYGPAADEATCERVLLGALDAGITCFDTATLYGFGSNEAAVGRILRAHRSRYILCSKGGMGGEPIGPGGALQRVIDARPATLRRHVHASLARLQTEVIDLYYLHRLDPKVAVEESVGELGRLMDEGKIRSIGLSEVSAPTLRRAHAERPIAAVQSEYSLWSRNPEIAVLAACREIGAAFVAFSPVGRGFLTDSPPATADLKPGDIRLAMPRFEPAHRPANERLRSEHLTLAREAGCSAAQLALAWLLQRDPGVIPIPGTTRLDHLHEDLGAAALTLEPGLVQRLEALWSPQAVSGERYNPPNQREVDTETFS
jgi:aryl-alcohol dehydrogenase-like predicted oxidoreductase